MKSLLRKEESFIIFGPIPWKPDPIFKLPWKSEWKIKCLFSSVGNIEFSKTPVFWGGPSWPQSATTGNLFRASFLKLYSLWMLWIFDRFCFGVKLVVSPVSPDGWPELWKLEIGVRCRADSRFPKFGDLKGVFSPKNVLFGLGRHSWGSVAWFGLGSPTRGFKPTALTGLFSAFFPVECSSILCPPTLSFWVDGWAESEDRSCAVSRWFAACRGVWKVSWHVDPNLPLILYRFIRLKSEAFSVRWPPPLVSLKGFR